MTTNCRALVASKENINQTAAILAGGHKSPRLVRYRAALRSDCISSTYPDPESKSTDFVRFRTFLVHGNESPSCRSASPPGARP